MYFNNLLIIILLVAPVTGTLESGTLGKETVQPIDKQTMISEKDIPVGNHQAIIKGDIIKSINGIEVNDPPHAIRLLYKLRDQNKFNIVVERHGKLERIMVSLKDK